MLQEGPGAPEGGAARRGLGPDPAGNPPGRSEPRLSLAPYLLVYDAEDAGCRRLVDWVQRRDDQGLVVSFPFQNAELLNVAPEFAGLWLDGQVLGFDTRIRRIDAGPELVPELYQRLSGWRRYLVAPLTRLRPLARLLYAAMRR